MICKNCGAQLPDNSMFCGECGTAQDTQPAGFGGNMPNPAPNTENSNVQSNPNLTFNSNPNPNGGFDPKGGFSPNMPSAPNVGGLKGLIKSNNKIVTIAIPVAALILVAAIISGVVSIVGSNPDKTIDRFMTGFIECDGEAMNKEISKSYKKAIVYTLETLDIFNDGELSEEADGNIDKYVEKLLTENFGDMSENFFEYFEYNLGKDYDVEYEVTEKRKADKDQLKKFNELVSRVSGNNFEMKGLMIADIKISGKSGSDKYENEISLFLCKDSSKWEVIDIFESGYDFDDLYSGLSINDLRSYF